MNKNSNIDELLNGFIDEELTIRQLTELRRLISNNADILKRLDELRKCKMLVNALAPVKAPDNMLDDIKAALERRTLLGQQTNAGMSRGHRHLIFRKVLAAAAMIGLFGVLAVVIYTIISPGSVKQKPMAVKEWSEPAKVAEIREAAPVIPAVRKQVAKETAVIKGFSGTVELKTNNLAAANSAIKKAIEDNGLWDALIFTGPQNNGRYTINCTKKALTELLIDLNNIWTTFDSADFIIDSPQATDGQIVISQVMPEQIAEIANLNSQEKRVELAKDLALLNKVPAPGGGQETATGDDMIRKLINTLKPTPKPVLTSGGGQNKIPGAKTEDEEKINLTIVIVGRE